MTTTKMKQNGRVFSYMRWSSEPQTWGDSERRQVQAAEDWCRRQGRTLADRAFADRGVSGWKGANRQNGALGALLKEATSGDTILIEDTDRWSREAPLDSLNALRDTVNRDVEIVFLKTGVTVNKSNFNDPGVLFPNFFGSFLANAENEKRAYRIREAMKSRQAQIEAGQAVQGRLPAWLEWDRKLDKPVVVPEKVKVVRRIFDLCLAGHGVKAIEGMMRGTPSITNSRRSTWNGRFVYVLLTNKSVLGHKLEANTGKYSDKKVYPQVIEEETFYAAAAKLKERKKLTFHVDRRSKNLFTGLVRCSKCGSRLVKRHGTSHGKGYDYLICGGNARRTSDCPYSAVNYRKFEASFLSLISKTDLIAKALCTDHGPSRLDTLKGELADVHRECNKIETLIGDDENPSRRLYEKLKALEAKETALQAEIDAEQMKSRSMTPPDRAYAKFTADLLKHVGKPEYRERVKAAFREIVESITVEFGEKTAYRVMLRSAKMPIDVILARNGWLFSPTPEWALSAGDRSEG
jgi:DNA invertase Pin-like site-specific DNA recombinase